MGALTGAQVSTDKSKYAVGETMILSGSGYTPSQSVVISVLRPDHVTDSVTEVVANSLGNFTASYTPSAPAVPGRYKITATDGTNTATTASTEADAIGYNKGVYNKGAALPQEDITGNWTSGNAGKEYAENQWAFYQYQVEGVGSSVPDFDVAFNHFQQATNAIFIDALADFRACLDCTEDSFTSGPSQGMLLDTKPVPRTDLTNWKLAISAISHINRPLNTLANGTGTMVMSGSGGFCSSDAKEPVPNGTTTFPAEFHCFHVSGAALKGLFGNALDTGTHTITLFYAAHLAASFVWGNKTAGVGAHEGSLGDCTTPFYPTPLTGPVGSFQPLTGGCGNRIPIYGTDAYIGWNTSALLGMGFASGASRHFSLQNQSAGSSGAIELPIPTVPTPTNTIIITKVTNPANATGVTFPYTSTGVGNFSLTSPFPSSRTFVGVSSGVEYDVTETTQTNWKLTSVTCAVTSGSDDGTGSFTGTTSTALASIIFGATDSGVTVTCTYTNTQAATPSVTSTLTNAVLNGSVAVGGTVKDTANLDTTSSANLIPSGSTVTFQLFNNLTCTSPTILNTYGPLPVTSGVQTTTVDSPSFTPAAGSYSYLVTFTSGDPTVVLSGVGACEPFTVVDARIALSPLTATNEIGQTHTITATVSQNDGLVAGAPGDAVTGLGPAPNGTLVTFSLLNNTAVASFVGGVNTCTTTGGTCAVTINGTTAGGVDIHATTTFSVGGVSLTRASGDGVSGDSANAHKSYVGGSITITPTAVNEVNHAHTFTVTLTQANDGVTAATTANITTSVSPAPGSSSTTCGAAVAFSGATATCTLIINNPTGGVFTANATGVFTVGGVTITRATGDAIIGDGLAATKTYVDARIVISPLAATNPVNAAHTITATVSQDPGTGFVAAPNGTTVTFSLLNNTPNAIFVGGVNTCTTTAGVCTVQINSSAPGGVDIHATTTFSVLGVSLTRSTGDGLSGDSANAHKDYVAGTIIIRKVTVPTGGTGFGYTTTGGLSPATFSLDDGQNRSYANQVPGPYSVTENDPTPGYDLTNINCSATTGAGTSATPNLATRTIAITLAGGGVVDCTYINTKRGAITIVKNTVGGDGTFSFTSNFGVSSIATNTTTHTGSQTVNNLTPGNGYNISETVPAGWDASAFTCDHGTSAAIQVLAGQTTTCTITNTRRGAIQILKAVSGVHDGVFAFSSNYYAGQISITTTNLVGTSTAVGNLVPASTYAISEIVPAGYVFTTAQCTTTGSQSGTGVTGVTVLPGATTICTFTNTEQAKAKVVKTVQGAPPSGSQAFTFQLRQGASPTQNGTTLETQIANAANGGILNFASLLVPGSTYQVCEIVLPGWSTSLGNFVPGSFNPPDGTVPNPAVDNSILCGNFTPTAGQLVTFTIDNTPPPGGRALTIGFWKNWASCANSNGNKKPVLDQTLALFEPTGEVISAAGGIYPIFAADYYLVLHGSTATPDVAPGCTAAVNLLNKSTITKGTKSASDPAFNLAAQLVAAQLNYAAGAGKTPLATTAINQAVLILGKYHFNGDTYSPKITAADATTMNNLATTLDNYNNDRP